MPEELVERTGRGQGEPGLELAAGERLERIRVQAATEINTLLDLPLAEQKVIEQAAGN